MKNPNNPIGNRTHDSLSFSAGSQPPAPPLTPVYSYIYKIVYFKLIALVYIYSCMLMYIYMYVHIYLYSRNPIIRANDRLPLAG
jgi:hypothetical protein